jgi:uncharacterized protein (DUF58 family)
MSRPWNRTPFTTSGWATLGTAVTLYTLGILLGFPILVTLAVTGLAVVAFAAVTVVVRPNVRTTREITPDRISVGGTALGKLVVRSLARWPVPSLVVVDNVGGRPHDIPVPTLRAGGSRTVHYPVPIDRRGRLQLGPLTVERRDPFGLFRRAQPQGGTSVLWVHPRVHQLRSLAVGTVPDFEGRTAVSKAGTTTFASLREYVPGDDPRRIHWRSTARTGQLIVRESVDTMEPTVSVVLDCRASMFNAATFEHAVELAASVTQSTAESGRPARLRIVGQDPASAAAAGAVSLLDHLAAAEQTTDSDPLRLLEEVDRGEPGGALVVVTGTGEPAVVARLAEQRRRFAPVVVIVMVAEGAPMPAAHRRPGMVLLSARTAVEAATAWNHFTLGGAIG